ncbi:hypothetical protein P171DRAFT_21042 [Karstenula rhodostoma CBS 690.94]|uniref:Uncharacterized protein n=1 Tax=Karstenula rhodostoma CBS 690.94 TaxID=1392251 RepID=A0A9P4PXS0_9PLEO|nr:hypothetical protein P171DRAFT_21042 [Karstenula rhodostoma CBS 690.94]
MCSPQHFFACATRAIDLPIVLGKKLRSRHSRGRASQSAVQRQQQSLLCFAQAKFGISCTETVVENSYWTNMMSTQYICITPLRMVMNPEGLGSPPSESRLRTAKITSSPSQPYRQVSISLDCISQNSCLENIASMSGAISAERCGSLLSYADCRS